MAMPFRLHEMHEHVIGMSFVTITFKAPASIKLSDYIRVYPVMLYVRKRFIEQVIAALRITVPES